MQHSNQHLMTKNTGEMIVKEKTKNKNLDQYPWSFQEASEEREELKARSRSYRGNQTILLLSTGKISTDSPLQDKSSSLHYNSHITPYTISLFIKIPCN